MPEAMQQEVFDKVWNHFIVDKGRPGVKPVRPLFKTQRQAYYCSYPSGCAVGILFSKKDQVELETSETLHTHYLLVTELRSKLTKEGQKVMLGCGATFLVDLRMAHDSAVGTVVRDDKKLEEGFLPEFKQHLERLAHKWGLKVPEEQAC